MMQIETIKSGASITLGSVTSARDREHLLLAAGKLTPVEPPTKFDLII
jgi:hypothetical protein